MASTWQCEDCGWTCSANAHVPLEEAECDNCGGELVATVPESGRLMPHGVHAKDQTAFRLDPDLRVRLKGASEEDGRTMTDVVSEAITDWLDRRDGITTTAGPVSPPSPAPVFLAAEDEQPERARKNCKHKNMRGVKGVCPDCHQAVGYKNGDQ